MHVPVLAVHMTVPVSGIVIPVMGSSAKPVREIHFKGAAAERMTMEILDLKGKIVFASSGPFRRGNVYSEHKVKVPAKAGQRFILRFSNHASTWFYIESLTLK